MSAPLGNFQRTQDPTLVSAIESLGPDSYTTHRLQHSSAEHVHLTTRRCFIGPIPEGWLKTHRKEWYKHYLHIHHSSKVPSFRANTNVGHDRRVTGLDGQAESAEIAQSFPQPEDADAEETENEDGAGVEELQEADEDEEIITDQAPAMAPPRAQTNPEDPVLREDLEGGVEPEPSSFGTALHSYTTAPDHSSPPEVSSPEEHASGGLAVPTRRSMQRTTSGRSYVTASDGVEGTEDEDEDATETEIEQLTPQQKRRSVRFDEVEEPRLRYSSTVESSANGTGPGSPDPGGHGSTRSTTPLLHAQKHPTFGEPVVQAESSTTAGAAPSQHVDLGDRPSSATSKSAMYATSRTRSDSGRAVVRFSMPDVSVRKRELQLRARVSQIGRRRITRAFLRSNLKDGEIVKMEKMLVRMDIATGPEQPSADYDEKDSQRVETRVVEKWREFMVVCRESHEDEEDASLALQMYKTRVIPATNQTKTKKRPKHQVALNPKQVKVNLFSALDKTVVVWYPSSQGTRMFFLRPRSGTDAVEWYHFLRNVLGWHRAQTLQVNIPDLRVSLRLDNPFDKLQASRDLAEAAEGDENALKKVLEEEQAIAKHIVDRCMEMLAKIGDWDDVLSAWARNDSIGLAWKRYDRLEWIHGVNERKMYGTIAMQKTHELELRQKIHYPIDVRTRKGKLLQEPAPIEGFLIRLTSQKGRDQKLGKLFFKRLYFTTHNQYLLFLRPAKAQPPPPPKMPMSETSKVPSAKQIADKIPLIYAVNPFPMDKSTISWLQPRVLPADEIEDHDRDAYDEAERNVSALLDCDGFINLCDVVKVRKVHRGATPADAQMDEGSDVDFDAEVEDTHRDDGKTNEFDDDRTFELVMRNGLVVRLQAFNKATKIEWMKRLRDLVKYWTSRVSADMALYQSVRQENIRALGIDERTEASVGSFAHKWEVRRSFASPELYNMCGISACRSIHMSGDLFRKPRRHATFTRCHVILSHGHLLIFQDTLRKATGKKLQHIHHERIASIDLKDCYLYAGLITENDLLYQNRTFDANMPGNHALPRIYLEDGWTSTDEDAMTCFVIWHGQRKGWFRSSKEQDDVRDGEAKDGKRQKLKRVSQLGVPGRSIVFKARSRAERDHWVLAIGVEIEKLAQGEDVRVVEDEK